MAGWLQRAGYKPTRARENRYLQDRAEMHDGTFSGMGNYFPSHDLFAVDGDVARRLDADPDLIAVDLHDRDHDAVADHDLLVHLAAQDQHDFLPVDE